MTPMQILSIALLVLAGAAFLFFSKRNAMDDDFSELDSDSAPNAVESEPRPTAGINARHVAAITAAILAVTHGRGKIIDISPVSRAAYSEATQRWRAAGIVASVGRRLAPSWKR